MWMLRVLEGGDELQGVEISFCSPENWGKASMGGCIVFLAVEGHPKSRVDGEEEWLRDLWGRWGLLSKRKRCWTRRK